jgi:hypothetical protein
VSGRPTWLPAVLLPLRVVSFVATGGIPVVIAALLGRNDVTEIACLAWMGFAAAGALVTTMRPAGSAWRAMARGAAMAIAVGAPLGAWLAWHLGAPARGFAVELLVPFVLDGIVAAGRAHVAAALRGAGREIPLAVANAAGAVVSVGVIAAASSEVSAAAIPWGLLAGDVVAGWVLAASARAAGAGAGASAGASAGAGAGAGAGAWVCAAVAQTVVPFAGVVGGGTLLLLSCAVALAPAMLVPEVPVTRRSVAAVLAAMVAASVVLAVAREPLTGVLYGHGAMDYGGLRRIMHLLPYALCGTAPLGALRMLERTATNEDRLRASGLAAAATALVAAALVRPLGLEGLALAMVAGITVGVAVLGARRRT